jgi:HEAT repeat protein
MARGPKITAAWLALSMWVGCAHLRPEEVRAAGEARDWGKLLDYLRDERGWVREEAALALGRMRAQEARATLETVLLDRRERSWVRAASATALGEIDNPASIGALTGVALQNETPPEVKIAAIGSLCAFADASREPLETIRSLAKDEDLLVAALAEDSVASRCHRRGRKGL